VDAISPLALLVYQYVLGKKMTLTKLLPVLTLDTLKGAQISQQEFLCQVPLLAQRLHTYLFLSTLN